MTSTKRSGPLATVAKIAFAAPFLVGGAVAFVAGLRDVLGGNLRSWFAFPFGALFFGAGAFVVRQALQGTRSAEAVAAEKSAAPAAAAAAAAASDVMPVVKVAADYRSPAGTARSAREVYGAALGALPVQKLELRPGQVLAAEVSLHAPQGSFVEIFVALLWNGFVWPFLFVAVGARSILGSLVSVLFCGVGLFILVATVRKILGRQRLPRVEVSAEPAYLGDELRLHVDQMGPARITRYVVGVRCEEIVKYTVGTNTRTERHEVWDTTLFDEPGTHVRLGEHWTHDLRVQLPAEAPASFESANNQVLWTVRVHAEIAGWPDYDEGFAFRALPRPAA